MATYNGWKNWETWNVALWLQNDEPLYRMMRQCAQGGGRYDDLADLLRECGTVRTPDGASYSDPVLDTPRLDAMLKEEVE